MIRRRRNPRDRAWHEARIAEGPQGNIRERGILTWDQFHAVMGGLVRNWERLPMPERLAYAFPNPEDRRHA